MSKIKSRLYELYLAQEAMKGSKMVLTEEAFYEQYASEEKPQIKENPKLRAAYEEYTKTLSIFTLSDEIMTFKEFKDELIKTGTVKIETIFGVAELRKEMLL